MSIKNLYKENEVKIKKLKDKAIEPLVRLFSYLKISPTFLSLLSLIFGITAAISLVSSKILFVELMFISLFFDWIDGSVARFTNKWRDSKKGFWLDYSFDRTVVVSVMIVVYILSQDKQTLYLSAIVLYVLANLLFIFNYKKFQIIYIRTGYFIVLIFDNLYATYFAVILSAINILNFAISYLRKKPL